MVERRESKGPQNEICERENTDRMVLSVQLESRMAQSNLFGETLLSISEATKRLSSRLGWRKLATTTVWRWCRKGTRGCRLEHVQLGGKLFTSEQAIGRFAAELADATREQLNRGSPAQHKWKPVVSPSIRRVDQARRRLRDAGIRTDQHIERRRTDRDDTQGGGRNGHV